MVPRVDSAFLTYYVPNAEWTYTDSLVQGVRNTFSDVLSLTIVYQRQSKFLINNILLPILMMVSINMLVFVIPPDAGERLSYSITCLLAVAVYLTIVGENLPKSSSPMPIFCSYLTAMIVLSVSMCVLTILNLHFYHKDEHKLPPKLIQSVVAVLRCRFCRIQPSSQNEVGDFTAELAKTPVDRFKTEFSWKEVCYTFDVVWVVIVSVVSVIVNVYFLLVLQEENYSRDSLIRNNE